MLGEAHTKLGHYEEAERWYKAALDAEPDHVPAHLKYGRMLAKNVSYTTRACKTAAVFLFIKRKRSPDTDRDR